MKIAVHLDPEKKDVVGVWLHGKRLPVSYYPIRDWRRQLGFHIMESFVADRAVDWDSWCEYLARKMPNQIWWEAADAVDSETPEQAYRRLSGM